jgi:hypothetical protein
MIRVSKLSFGQRLAVVVVVAAALVIGLVAWRHAERAQKQPTLAQLAATNYRTLSRHESRVLLEYARDEYRCLSSHGLDISAPVASRTRIRMSATHHGADELVHAMMACDPSVGPPPKGSSLQARPDEILVYLPKRCLMNPYQLPQA